MLNGAEVGASTTVAPPAVDELLEEAAGGAEQPMADSGMRTQYWPEYTLPRLLKLAGNGAPGTYGTSAQKLLVVALLGRNSALSYHSVR